MHTKKTVLFLTIMMSCLSLYYLSFTVQDYRIQHQAEQQAIDGEGKIDFEQRQAYLMEIWKKPVCSFFGISYTYEEVKDRALKLGLDLQGGMRVVLEPSPLELVQGLASYNRDPSFIAALQSAERERAQGHTASFARLFIKCYKEIEPEGNLIDIFTDTPHPIRRYALTNENDIVKAIDQEMADALKRSLTIIRTRLDRFGASQPNVQQLPRSNRIQIELPGVTNPERIRKLLQGVAQLRFWEVMDYKTYLPKCAALNKFLLEEERAKILSGLPKELTEEEREQHMPSQSLLQRLAIDNTFPLTYAVQDIDQIKKLLDRPEIRSLFGSSIAWMWSKPMQTSDKDKLVSMLYPIQTAQGDKPLLEGNIITYAEAEQQEGRSVVNLRMQGKGAAIWKEITANHIGKRIAIALDGQIYSAPIVQQEIPNGFSQISGDFTIEEAKDLASVLQAGSLPAPLKVVEEAIIGPSLSKTAQQQGLVTTAVGLALVLMFMMVYYGQGGMIANGALLFNLLFIAGILAQLEATLTLPGIAGLVLTLGMSIDANVLIFERIREEIAKNLPIQEAIKRGYTRSYSSIIDANITTFLVGIVLYCFGQGQVRGFAIILMIGIISSVFSSIFITQLIFSYLFNRYPDLQLSFSYGRPSNFLQNLKLNFIAARYWFYTCSLLFIGLGAFCYAHYKGLSVGVDFSGGRAYVVRFDRPVTLPSLKERLSTVFEGIEVRTYGANNVLCITTSYLSHEDTPTADEAVKCKLVSALESYATCQTTTLEERLPHGGFHVVSHTKVGATIAREVQKSSKQAIAFSLIGIFLYIALRFRKWRYGLAAIVALIHDVLAVIAGFCIARALGITFEVDEVFLAAILTIIGYSINDTVVIFDRIREILSTRSTPIYATVINHAIRETLSRTIITSFTTLLTVVVLFFFGGDALHSFSFALLLGILFGTYSSICIAAPLLADFRGTK